MRRGLFLTLEGLDGSGKTTQMERLTRWLQQHLPPVLAQNQPVASRIVTTRQPGGTAVGDQIRALALDSRTQGLAPMTELALMFADRAQAIQQVIEPALAAGKVVLCDRFTDSTEAYQGGGRQLGSELVLGLHRLLCGGLQPDLTILLLPSLELSLSRARRRNQRTVAANGADEGRFEAEADAFFGRVWEKYAEIARREPERVVVIAGNLNIEETFEQILEAVSERLIAESGSPA